MEKFKSSFKNISAIFSSTLLVAGTVSMTAVMSNYPGVVCFSVQTNGIRLILDGSGKPNTMCK